MQVNSRKKMENDLKVRLLKHNVKLKKAYGQNFLTDASLLNEIVEKAGVTSLDTVLEIGPGAGALTYFLASKAKKVVCYEIDTSLKPVLDDVLEDFNNTEIVFKDVMKESLEVIESKLGDEYIMVANLPYYITTPIVMRFLENSKKIKAMVIMVQEEVATRFSAPPKNTDYGAITVAINLRGKAQKILRVGREKFTPVPNVDSAIVKIDIDHTKNAGVDLDNVREVVKVAFSSRRKMLVNNLMNFYKLPRSVAESVLTSAGVSLTARAEELSSDEFINLTNALREIK